MAEHTQGPWDIFTIASPAGTSYRIFGPGDKDIAHIPMDWANKANARLIAAAPELLQAAKGIEKALKNATLYLSRPQVMALCAAIAKAEGH